MSDAPAPMEGQQAVEGGPPEVGSEAPGASEAAPDTSATTEPPPEPPEFLDVDSVADKHVRLKVDGEEVAVPLSEALQGYQREGAFTKRMQELAEQRKEAERALVIQDALQRNPAMTIQILANEAGMSVEQFVGLTPAQQQQAVADGQANDDYADPLERELNEVRTELRTLQESRAQEAADRELAQVIGGLKSQFQVDDEEIIPAVQQAFQRGLPFDQIPVIFRAMQFEKMTARQEAASQDATRRQTEEQQRAAAAAAAAQTVSQGGGATNLQGAPASETMSLRDAIAAGIESASRR